MREVQPPSTASRVRRVPDSGEKIGTLRGARRRAYQVDRLDEVRLTRSVRADDNVEGTQFNVHTRIAETEKVSQTQILDQYGSIPVFIRHGTFLQLLILPYFKAAPPGALVLSYPSITALPHLPGQPTRPYGYPFGDIVGFPGQAGRYVRQPHGEIVRSHVNCRY